MVKKSTSKQFKYKTQQVVSPPKLFEKSSATTRCEKLNIWNWPLQTFSMRIWVSSTSAQSMVSIQNRDRQPPFHPSSMMLCKPLSAVKNEHKLTLWLMEVLISGFYFKRTWSLPHPERDQLDHRARWIALHRFCQN